MKLLDICEDKIDQELDVIKLIKNLKYTRIITKKHFIMNK